MRQIISYIRVSTGKQGRSGLGIEAQREALARLYYDTGLAGTAVSLDPVLDVTTPDHIIYGADFGAPCTHLSVCDYHLAATRGYQRLTPAQRRRRSPIWILQRPPRWRCRASTEAMVRSAPWSIPGRLPARPGGLPATLLD